jgi:hypothetical protein
MTFSRHLATFSRRSSDTCHRYITIRHNLSQENMPIMKKNLFLFYFIPPPFSSFYFPLSHTHINYKTIYYFCLNCHFKNTTCPSNIALVIFTTFKSSFNISIFSCNDLILVSHFFFLSFISSLPYYLLIIIISNILKYFINIPFSFWFSFTGFTILALFLCPPTSRVLLQPLLPLKGLGY